MLKRLKENIALALADQLFASDKFQNELLPAYLKANPIGALTVTESFDNAQPHPFDFAKHLVVYRVNVYCAGAMRAIASDVASTPVQIQRRVRVDGEFLWRTEDESNATAKEIIGLFRRPNTDETWNQLSERWVISHQATGNSYLAFDEQDKEFWYMKPDWVKVKTDARGRPVGYVVAHKALKELLEFANVIHLKSANPSGDWYGMPPAESIKETIMTKLSLNTYLNSYLKNAGLLGLIVSGDSLDLTDEEQRRIVKKELNSLYKGPDKAGGTAVFGGDITAQLLTHNLKDMVPDTLDELVRREVCVAYKVPPIKLMILDEATYNNAREQDKIYQRGTVEPERCLIEDTINLQFIWPRYGEDWRYHYDRSEVLGLQEDRTATSVYVTAEFKAGLIDKNTAREALNYEPLEEGGDEFFVDTRFSQNPLSETEAGSSSGETSLTPLSGKSAKASRLDMWKAIDDQLKKRTRKMKTQINAFFDEQLDRLLEKLDKVTGGGKIMSRLELFIKDGIPEGMINDLFDILKEDELIAIFMADVMEGLAEEAGEQALQNADIDFQFDVQDPRMAGALEGLKNRIADINQTTWRSVKRLVGDSYEAGHSIEKMAERLSKRFSQFKKGRALTIAKTETNKLSQLASFEAFTQAGIERKEWLSVQDSHVRDAHAVADGEIVTLGEPFLRTGEPLMHPSDPSGSAWNVINCRCQVVVPEEEGEGEFIE